MTLLGLRYRLLQVETTAGRDYCRYRLMQVERYKLLHVETNAGIDYCRCRILQV